MIDDEPPQPQSENARMDPDVIADELNAVIKGEPRKHNLLFGMNGNARLQRKLSFGEYRGKGKPTWKEKGMPVTGDGPSDDVGRKDKEKLRGIKAWILSDTTADGKACWNFCIDCGRTDVSIASPHDHLSQPSPGATVISENRPDLDLRPGDMVMYWVCARCEKYRLHLMQKPDDYESGVLVDQYGNSLNEDEEERAIDRYERERTQRMIKNMVEWIRVKLEKGETPRTFQGD